MKQTQFWHLELLEDNIRDFPATWPYVMCMTSKSPPRLPVHPLHEHAVLTTAGLLKGFHLIIHLMFSSVIIPFLLPLWKCYNFLYRRPASPCLFIYTWVSNVQLLPTERASRNLPYPYTCLMTSGVYFKSRCWTSLGDTIGQMQFLIFWQVFFPFFLKKKRN